MTLARLGLVACLLVGAMPSTARADEAALLAKEHFRQGSKLFDLQRYMEAAAEYERAYDSKEIPALLYNIGQAYRLGNEPKKAIAAYRAYLRRLPDAANRAEVTAFIEALKRTIEATKAAQEKPPIGPIDQTPTRTVTNTNPIVTPPPQPAVIVTPPPPRREPDQVELAQGRKLRLAGYGVGAVGVAGLVLGGVFAGLTVETNNQLNHPAATNPPPVYNKGLESKGRTYQALTPAMFAVGGAALITGVTLIVVGTHKVKRNSFAVAPVLGRNVAALSFSGEF